MSMLQERLTVGSIDPIEDPRWQRLVERHGASVFLSPDWLRVLSDTYGWDVRACVVFDLDGEPLAGVPYCRIADIISQRVVCLPFSDYCDPLVADPEHWHAIVDHLSAWGDPIDVRCLDSTLPLEDERFTLFKRARWHGIDLRRDPDTIWRSLSNSARWSSRKADHDGVETHIAQGKDGLRAFFDLHLRVRKYKHRLLAQPYEFFENIWREFVERGRGAIMLATHGDTVIGGVCYLEWGDTLYYKFNASDPACLVYRPNDRMIWEGIQYGQQRGLSVFDFGLTDWDHEGLLFFKRKFASVEKTISYLRRAQESGPSDHERQLRTLLAQLTGYFVDETVPDRITELAGRSLYRFFT